MTGARDPVELRRELRQLARSWARSRRAERARAARVAEVVRELAATGEAPETELTELAQADRGTIRAWLGKGRARRLE